MNLRLSGNELRVRLAVDETRTLLDRGFLDQSTRFPNGKRFRYGVRIARVPAGEKALPIVLNFSTEGGGFGADLVLVVLETEVKGLLEKAGSKTAAIEGAFPLPDAGAGPDGAPEELHVALEIDSFSVKKA